MRPVALAGVLLAFTATLCVAVGCASSGSDLPAAQPPTRSEPPATLTAELPAPSALKLTQGVLSNVYHTGVDYVDGWPRQRVWNTDEETAAYRPQNYVAYFDMQTVDRPAYATYHFDATGFAHGSTITVNWAQPGDSGEAWLGMADWAADSWRWHLIGPEGIAHFDAEACLDDGIGYAIVLVPGTAPWWLASIHLGFALPPVISSVSPLSGEEGEEITLSALLNIPEEQVAAWDWQLDGAGSIGTSSEARPTLTLGSAGIYECSVRASNAWGETDHSFHLVVDPEDAGWHHTVVDSVDDLSLPTSLALTADSPANPHIAYKGSHLKHAYSEGGFWRLETVALSADSMTSSSLAVESDGTAHLAYTHSESPDEDYHYYLIHALAPGGVWEHRIRTGYVRPYDLDLEMTDYRYPTIALDADDNTGLCYRTCDYIFDPEADWWPVTDYLSYKGNSASEDAVTAEAGALGRHAISFYASGNPGIAYVLYDESRELRFAVRTGIEAWEDELVEPVDFLFSQIALEISAMDDQPRICYTVSPDPEPAVIRYARFDGTEWRFRTVSGTGDVGRHFSMALDSGGGPRICYYDETEAELHYAAPVDLGWDVVTVDSDGDVGQYCDIAVDQHDRAHISYYDETNGCIKYARQAVTK